MGMGRGRGAFSVAFACVVGSAAFGPIRAETPFAASEASESQVAASPLIPASEVADESLLVFHRQFSVDRFVTGSLADSAEIADVPRAAVEEAERALALAIDTEREVRTGDRFYMRWEEDYSIDNRPLGTSRMLTAELRTARKGTIAISRFRPLTCAPEAPTPFYFANGQEAGAAPVKLPLDHIQITSGFGLRTDPLDQPERVPPVVAQPAPVEAPAPTPVERALEDKKEILHAYLGRDRGQLGGARDAGGQTANAAEIDRIMAERRVRRREEEARQKADKEAAEKEAAARAMAPQPQPAAAAAPKLLFMHEGLDLLANLGTPIHAAADGIVTLARRDRGYGNAIHLQHGAAMTTIYGHLSRFAEGVEAGARVVRGQTIGYVGNTGRSTGAHLHFEVLLRGRPVDPQTVARPTQLAGFDLARFRKQLAREQQERAQNLLDTPAARR